MGGLVGPYYFDDIVFAFENKDERPGENPKKSKIEDPAQPCLLTVLVYPMRGIDNDAILDDWERDFEVAAVVGTADEGAEEGFEAGGVVVCDGAGEGEGFDGGGVFDVETTPFGEDVAVFV